MSTSAMVADRIICSVNVGNVKTLQYCIECETFVQKQDAERFLTELGFSWHEASQYVAALPRVAAAD